MDTLRTDPFRTDPFRTDPFRTYVVVNPTSAGGGTGGRWRRLLSSIEARVGEVEVGRTTHAGHATELTRAALRSGFEMIVAVGGDGTVHEVVNGFFDGDEPIVESPVLGLVPSGTGGDYRKAWNLSNDPAVAVNALGGRATRTADLGRIRWTEPGVGPCSRIFANIASFGMSAEVSRRVNSSSKRLGGKASFFLASFRSALSYERPNVTLVSDGDLIRHASLNVGAVAIGRFFGGGMHIAPQAQPDDGRFDVVTIGERGLVGMLGLTSVYTGQHLSEPDVGHWQAEVVEASSASPCFIEADGEVFGRLPARFEILPGAFRMKVAG